MMLTPNQLKVFDFINSYIKQKRVVLPTIREIARIKGLRTLEHLEDLENIEQRGYIKIHTGKHRGIEVLNGNSIQK